MSVHVRATVSWLGIAQERQTQAVSTTVYSPFLLGPEPNKGMELTAYSVRSFLAPAFGSSSYLALGSSGCFPDHAEKP